jgi:hypothetical protein
MARTWLIIGLVVSLVVNALFIGFIIGRPLHAPLPPLPPFPPLPPMAGGERVPGLREHISLAADSTRMHIRQLRRQLVMELASDATNRSRVDSLIIEINRAQRTLQLSIVDYIDSLRTIVPKKDEMELRHWIMECFGEGGPMRAGHHRSGHPGTEPPPSDSPR